MLAQSIQAVSRPVVRLIWHALLRHELHSQDRIQIDPQDGEHSDGRPTLTDKRKLRQIWMSRAQRSAFDDPMTNGEADLK